MQNSKLCPGCGAELLGPFEPEMTVSRISALVEEEAENKEEPNVLNVAAHPWICPGCGLLHWYADDGDLDKLLEQTSSDDTARSRPGLSYERRTQMQRMLRRLRRM